MNAHANPAWASGQSAASPTYPRTRIPSRRLEYGYYFSIFYSVMSPALGLSIGMVGARFWRFLPFYASCVLAQRRGLCTHLYFIRSVARSPIC